MPIHDCITINKALITCISLAICMYMYFNKLKCTKNQFQYTCSPTDIVAWLMSNKHTFARSMWCSFIDLQIMWLDTCTGNCYRMIWNQSTVSTAKRLASLFWYLIASTINTLQNTIKLMAMKLHVYGTWRTMYLYVWSKQMLILYFKNLLFLFLIDLKLRKSN